MQANEAEVAVSAFGSLEEWLAPYKLQAMVPKLEQAGVSDVNACLQLTNEQILGLGLSAVQERRLPNVIQEALQKLAAQEQLVA